jgi:hypothetical protein
VDTQNFHDLHVKCVTGQCSTTVVTYKIIDVLPDDEPLGSKHVGAVKVDSVFQWFTCHFY